MCEKILLEVEVLLVVLKAGKGAAKPPPPSKGFRNADGQGFRPSCHAWGK